MQTRLAGKSTSAVQLISNEKVRKQDGSAKQPIKIQNFTSTCTKISTADSCRTENNSLSGTPTEATDQEQASKRSLIVNSQSLHTSSLRYLSPKSSAPDVGVQEKPRAESFDTGNTSWTALKFFPRNSCALKFDPRSPSQSKYSHLPREVDTKLTVSVCPTQAAQPQGISESLTHQKIRPSHTARPKSLFVARGISTQRTNGSTLIPSQIASQRDVGPRNLPPQSFQTSGISASLDEQTIAVEGKRVDAAQKYCQNAPDHVQRTPILKSPAGKDNFSRSYTTSSIFSQRSLQLAKAPFPSQGSPISLGDDPQFKDPATYRFAFNNCNGISLTSTSLHFLVSSAKNLQVDWLGLAETHLDSTKSYIRLQLKNAFQSTQGYSMATCVFSASDLSFESDWKPGGICQIALENLATRTISNFSDKYGRYTAQTHIGRNGRKMTTITAYCVLEGCQGPSSAYSQQRAMLVLDNRPAHPRKIFYEDLTSCIQKFQEEGSEILLCLDANKTWTKPSSRIRKLATICGLEDVHTNRFPTEAIPSHCNGSTKIDYILASPTIIAYITRAGILPLEEAFCSDHRLMYIDVDIHGFFRGIAADPVHPRPRSFTTKNTKRTSKFKQTVLEEWARRNLSARIAILSRLSHLPSDTLNRQRLLEQWDKIDKEIGILFKYSEDALKTPKQRKAWSPTLARAGAIMRYWKTRLAHAQAGKSYGVNILRKSRELNIADDLTNDTEELKKRHDLATSEYENAAQKDDLLRVEHLDTMISSFPASSKDSNLKALKALKKAEAQKRMFSRISATLKPSRSGSVSRVDVPADLLPHVEAQSPDTLQVSTDDEDLKELLSRNEDLEELHNPDKKERWHRGMDYTF